MCNLFLLVHHLEGGCGNCTLPIDLAADLLPFCCSDACGTGLVSIMVHSPASHLNRPTNFTPCTLCCRHGAGAVSEEFGSFQAVSLLAILARAVSCGQIGMVKSLMSLLPQKDSPGLGMYRDASGMGLLHLAVRSGSLGMLATLLEDCNADAWQVSAVLYSLHVVM